MMSGVCFAQAEAGSSRINGVAVNGNTTTVFEAANNRDLEMGLLTRWSSFAQQHQEIARQLGYKAALIDDVICGNIRTWPGCSRKILVCAMNRDPGNFVANLPRSEE